MESPILKFFFILIFFEMFNILFLKILLHKFTLKRSTI